MISPKKTLIATAFVLALLSVAPPCRGSELEAARPFVGSIEFVGNEHIGGGELKRIMRTREPGFLQLFNKPRYRPDFLSYDLAAIEAYYHKNGYYEAVADVKELRLDRGSNSVHITIEIDEGPQTVVGTVAVKGLTPYKRGELERGLSLKPGAPFDSTLVGVDIYYLRNRMWDKGFVLTRISYEVALSDHTAELTYYVEPGPTMRIGEIEIRGNKVAEEASIRDKLTFKPGETFSLKKIHQSEQLLFDTSLFRQVNLVASRIDTTARTVDLLVEVRERKMSYVELGMGVGTEDNGRIAAEWGHRHLPWLGGKLQVESEISFDVVREGEAKLRNRYSRYRATYTGFRFPGTRLPAAVDAFLEKDRNPKTVDYDVWGLGFHVRKRMGSHTFLYFDLTDEFVERKIPPLSDDNPFGRESDETRSLGFTLDRDSRDDLLFPTGGSQRSFSFEVAGGPLRGDNHFTKVVGSLSIYRRVWRGVVFAARARAGLATPYGRSDDGMDPDGVPFERRFYAGGSNSVRGYRENSLGPRLPVGAPGSIDPRTAARRGDAAGGEALLLTNVELRFSLWKRAKLGGVLFLDGGNVWEKPSRVTLSDFRPVREMDGGGYTSENVTKYRYSFGIGLRYNTPIGPLRLDYGVPVARTGEIRSFGLFHFSLGHAF